MADPKAKPQARDFLGVRFQCAGAYARIYKAADGKSYQGRCPRCLKAIHVAIGASGQDSRQLIADCR